MVDRCGRISRRRTRSGTLRPGSHELNKYATLYPGDVLWMGTEGADWDMLPGDTIEVEISGIGTLRNYVVAEE